MENCLVAVKRSFNASMRNSHQVNSRLTRSWLRTNSLVDAMKRQLILLFFLAALARAFPRNYSKCKCKWKELCATLIRLPGLIEGLFHVICHANTRMSPNLALYLFVYFYFYFYLQPLDMIRLFVSLFVYSHLFACWHRNACRKMKLTRTRAIHRVIMGH